MGQRYEALRDSQLTWSVIDKVTGQPALLDEAVLIGLSIGEADVLSDLLNGVYGERHEAVEGIGGKGDRK